MQAGGVGDKKPDAKDSPKKPDAKDSPAQSASATPSGPAPASAQSRDGMLQIAAPYAQAHMTSAILVFKNVADWMVMDEDLAACALPLPKKK